MISFFLGGILGWFGRWGLLWIPVCFEIALSFMNGATGFEFDALMIIISLFLVLGFVAAGYFSGAGLHRLIKGTWPHYQPVAKRPLSVINWASIVAGLLVIASVFVWMAIIVKIGWTDAWWWFEWKEFKFVMLPFFIVGGALIGWGLRSHFIGKNTEQLGE